MASFFFVRRLRPREFKKEFHAINTLQERGDYKRAIIAYENLAARYHIQCMSLYYNLANAYYHTNDLGRAILYYTRAQKLAPRDTDVAANLRIAQLKARVTIRPERSAPPTSLGRKLLGLFSFFEGVAASLTFRWLLVVSVVLTVFCGQKHRYLVRFSIVLAVLFYLSFGATVYKGYVQQSFKEAVVLGGDSPVREKPGARAPTLKVLREGTTVHVQSRRNGWCRIVLEQGKVGWIREDHLGEV